jgi:hypothetical protein
VPLWIGRALMDGLKDGRGIVLLLGVDLLLALFHRRVNRIPEAVDWGSFGQHDSLTKAYYFPEAISWALIARDLVKASIIVGFRL